MLLIRYASSTKCSVNDMEEGSVYKPLPELTHASLSTEHLLVGLLFITRNLAETKHHLYYYILLLGLPYCRCILVWMASYLLLYLKYVDQCALK